jgi:hypothetical protein
MTPRLTALVCVLLATTPLALVSGAQGSAPPNTVSIAVTVVSAATGAPVAGVTLRLRTVPEATLVTDSLGRALFVGVPKRMEGIEAVHAEFEPRTEILLLTGADAPALSLTLPLMPRDATRLRTVTVRAEAPSRAPGLEVRRTSGRGRFIDRGDIDRIKPHATTDLLRRVAGLRVETSGGKVRVRSRRADCEMLLYLDGAPVYNETAPTLGRRRRAPEVVSIIDKIPPDVLEAIEVYLGPSETPPQYSRGGGTCGAILIWTRPSTR